MGDVAADLAEVCGRELDPEQALAVDAIMSTAADGTFAALEAAVVEPRQNGKSGGILLPPVLTGALALKMPLIVWSAHRYKTAHEAYLDLDAICTNVDSVRRRVTRVTRSNGEESFEFKGGSRVVFLARSQASGRGLSGDMVVLDEALFLTGSMVGALMPTLSARPNPLLIYGSSAGLVSSDVLREVRDRGRAGGDPSLVYVEWCAPEGGCASRDCDHHRDAVGCALDDRGNWRRANPALGRRISERVVAAERRSMVPRQFATERLGWWEAREVGGLFHMPAWFRLQDPHSQPGERLIFGVHVTPDRNFSAVAVAGIRGDGVMHVELVEHREGVSWLLPWLTDRIERHGAAGVVLAGSMAAGSLVVDLESLPGFAALNSTDVRRACGSFFDAVNAGHLAHAPHPDLDSAVQQAGRSSDRGEWVFDAPAGEDLSALYATALAAWGARTETSTDVSVFFFNDLDGDDDEATDGPDDADDDDPDDDEPPYGLVPIPR